MMDVRTALAHVVAGEDLTREESGAVMRQLMTGEATDAQIGAFLVALRAKGETTEEIVGAATTMRALATRVDVDLPNLVDTCGTGGSATKVFNVSTAAAFVTAAAGAHVAKHGNRAMTSKSGSADLLEAGGSRWTSHRSRSGAVSRRWASAFCLRRSTIRPCVTSPGRGARSAYARCSTCSAP